LLPPQAKNKVKPSPQNTVKVGASMKLPPEIGKAIGELNLPGALEEAISHIEQTPFQLVEEGRILLSTTKFVNPSKPIEGFREARKEHLEYLRSIGHPPVVSEENIDQITRWEQHRKDDPNGYLRNFRTYAKEHTQDTAEKIAVLRDHVTGSNLSVLEIGGRIDIAVPKLLQSQIARYTNVDADANPILARERQAFADRLGLDTSNHFLVKGSAAQLPIASNSQDVVFTCCTNPFIFSNDLPWELKVRSVAEALRVLKPAGTFIMRPYNFEVQSAGEGLLANYFPRSTVHVPTREDMAELARIKGKRVYSNQDDYRSYVGTKD
jgi:hypothetical protein